MKKELIVIGLAGVIIFGVIFLLSQTQTEEFHAHTDFRVILNATDVNFSQEKYMSSKEQLLSPFVHLHDNNGKVIHIHAPGVTLDDFFSSIGMEFSNECFELDTGEKLCNNEGKTLKLFVNGIANEEFENYEPRDLDRILITYGGETDQELQQQINSVSDEACIQSGKCPERGNPSPEDSCTSAGCTI